MKNTLPHIFNYETTIFDKKIIWKGNLEKVLERFKIQETYSLKQAQSIMYLNEYFYVFLYRERYYASTK